jgi:hypothetical protein
MGAAGRRRRRRRRRSSGTRGDESSDSTNTVLYSTKILCSIKGLKRATWV